MDVIHMNGRTYNPVLGRFLQADPIIQAPNDSQSYNRYAYVRNNPLSLTDPSGYSWLSKAWKKIKPFIGVIIVAVASFYCAGTCTAGMWAAIGGAAGGVSAAVNGGNIVTGALMGAFTAGAGQYGIVASAFAGGIAGRVQGGNFGHGFWAAGLGAGIGGGGGKGWVKVISAAVVGGTISELTGGKFRNGAYSAAFAAAMAADWGKSETTTTQSSSTSNKSSGSCSGCGKATLYDINDLSYERLVELRKGLYGARAEGYDALSIDAAISRINSRVSTIIGT